MKLIAVFYVSIIAMLLLSCSGSKNAEEAFAKMKEFTKEANAAADDQIIDDEEAAKLNIIIEALNQFDENEPSIEKALKKEENKKIFDDMGKAMIRLMFCEGAEKLEGI